MPRLLISEETALADSIGELVYGAAISRRREGEEISFAGCNFNTIGLCFLRVGYLDHYYGDWVNEPDNSILLEEGLFRDSSSVEHCLNLLHDTILSTFEVERLREYRGYVRSISSVFEESHEINEANIVQLHDLLLNKRLYRRTLDLATIFYEENWGRGDYQRHTEATLTASAVTYEVAPPYPGLDWSTGVPVSGSRGPVPFPQQELGADSPAVSRPSSHGQNDEAHNLDIKYRNCYVSVNGVVGKVITFQRNRDSGAVQIRYLLGIPETSTVPVKELLELYVPTKHILDITTLGWVKNDKLCTYLETMPGSYLRGVSENNTHSLVTILNNKLTREGNYRPDISTFIPELIVRKFDNISLGIKEKYNNIVITPEACLFLGKSPTGEHEKYFLMLASMCVGEHLKNIPAIKLYKQYKPLKSFIENVINYETK